MTNYTNRKKVPNSFFDKELGTHSQLFKSMVPLVFLRINKAEAHIFFGCTFGHPLNPVIDLLVTRSAIQKGFIQSFHILPSVFCRVSES